jgi:hypothetical protein
MKKFSLIVLGLLFSTQLFAQAQTTQTQQTTQTKVTPQDQARLQAAKNGCQKPLGFFPTPSKILCVLTAAGLSEQSTKAKEIALIFTVCKGYSLQSASTEQKAVKYNTLGACLKDPSALQRLNKELTAQGFQPVTIVNPTVLSS